MGGFVLQQGVVVTVMIMIGISMGQMSTTQAQSI